jgi:probable phosphoglycerate mutase
MQGHTDVPLNARGLEQAEAAARGLRDRSFDAIIASDLVRARRTAEIIAGEDARHIIVADPELRERALGVIEGRVTRDLASGDDEAASAWALMHDDPASPIPGGGESLEAFHSRVSARMQQLAHEFEGKEVLVVTHRGVLGQIMKMVMKIEYHARRTFAITNASVNVITWTKHKGWFLETWNSTSGRRDFSELSGCNPPMSV